MNITINFPPEIEQVLRHRAAATGQDLEAVVRQIVAEDLAMEPDIDRIPRHQETHQEFKASLRRIVDRHTGSGGRMDDSRESIYAGRGE